MIDYSFLRTTPKAQPATVEQIAAFRLARADNAERKAREWEEAGDEVQAARWQAEANRLREG